MNTILPVPAADGSNVSNKLLRLLPDGERRRLDPHLISRSVRRRQILYKSGQPMVEVFFPENVVCSVVCTMDNGAGVEIAMTGPEGVIGIGPLITATELFGDVVSHTAGVGYALSVEIFQREVERRGAFYEVMNWYWRTFVTDMMQLVACNGLHSAIQRTCRWLLMMADRAGSADCPLTHDGLALMLGLRRATVTVILRSLTDREIVTPLRGGVRIVDRRALVQSACECYRNAFGDRQFGWSEHAPSITGAPFLEAHVQ
jgi:CRP-like cAMP-binding protein